MAMSKGVSETDTYLWNLTYLNKYAGEVTYISLIIAQKSKFCIKQPENKSPRQFTYLNKL